jgi:cellulose synthase/poly-beta-1,6-N-acetylglucosamine synthase-like glycosyltransferase
MREKNKKPNLKRDFDYKPPVSLIISAYNEAGVIANKLKNVQEMDYPSDKVQVIVVDSASTDGTLEICKDFIVKNNLKFPVTLLSEERRMGKSHALNYALKYATGEITATSDADSFWDKCALMNAVSYFSDPSIGAVTGREELSNSQKNIHTKSEALYRGFYYTLRNGESQIHSTLLFQGELSLYRREAFSGFEDKPGYSDDIGTIINIISRGYRCIFAPDATFTDTAAFSLNGRLKLKSRRAEHLISGMVSSLKLKMQSHLPISWVVVLFNFYLHIISPFIFFGALIATGIMYFVFFQSLWFLGFSLFLLLFKKPRIFITSYFTSNLALILGLIPIITKKRKTTWQKIDEMRQ